MRKHAFLFVVGMVSFVAQAQNWGFGDVFKRSFGKDPLVVMTCELLLKSRLDAFATTQDITGSLQTLAARLNLQFSDDQAEKRSGKAIDFLGRFDELTSERQTQIAERLSALFQDQSSRDILLDRVAYEVRGKDILRALDFIEKNESEFERAYADARFATSIDPPWSSAGGYWTFSFYMKWYLINLSVIVGLFGDEPLKALLVAAGFHGSLIPIYMWRSWYNRSRTDAGFAEFKRLLRDWVANPPRDQVLMSSRSFAVSPRTHQAFFSSSANADQIVKGRQEALRLHGGSFIRNFTNTSYGASGFSDTYENLADFRVRYRAIYVDRLVYTDDEGEPVFIFSYRAFASAIRRRGRPKPAARSVGSPEENPRTHVPVPTG